MTRGLGWGVGGGAGEGCAGAGESSLTDSLDVAEVWGGWGCKIGDEHKYIFPCASPSCS